MYLDTSGIYKIVNNITKDFYIGSTVNLYKRNLRHFSELRHNKHYNKHLERSFNKYGESSFTFTPIVICEPSFLVYYEQALIDILKPTYNKRIDATTNLGVKRTLEFKKHVGDFFRGKKLSDEHIKSRDKSRALNSMKRNRMSGITIIPCGSFRAKYGRKHLGCFKSLDAAIKCRYEYILSVGGY